MNKPTISALLLMPLCAVLPAVAASADWLDPYDIVWTSPSANSSQSMPCGGGDIGLNVWVEDGSLLFYADRSGNIDENDQQLKSGRFRLTLDSHPFEAGTHFRQKLDLRSGSIELEGRGLRGRVWVEVGAPVIHVELEADAAASLSASYESWRTEKRSVPVTRDETGKPSGWDYNRWSMFGYFWFNGDVTTYPDSISFRDRHGVEFLHRNNNDDLIFDREVRQQKLTRAAAELAHPTRDRIFGGLMSGDGLIPAGHGSGIYAGTPYQSWILRSEQPARRQHLRIVLHTAQTPTHKGWRAQLDQRVASARADEATAWSRNLAWWDAFWERSRIVIQPTQGPDRQGWRVGRNYQVFRYQLACNVSGEWPTRFNGGLFTFDPTHVDGSDKSPDFYNPDFRAWGAWTAQNQRLLHWPMLKSGDFDAMKPQFEFYRRNLPNAVARTRESWGIEGASFGEQIGTGGLPLGSHYGWEPPHGDRDPAKETGLANLHATYYTTQLEFAFMLHEMYRFTGEDISAYLPLLRQVVVFHFEYFKMLETRRTGQPWGADGKLVLEPAHALETYRGRNPTDLICALRVNLEGLLRLPDAWTSPKEKALYREWLTRLPALNFRERDGVRVLSPVAGKVGPIGNYEIPQLYPVFPYGVYGIGLPDLQAARDTWFHGIDPCLGREPWTPPQPGDKPWYPSMQLWYGWAHQGIWLARLGLVDEARWYVTRKLDDARVGNEFDSPTRMRFPTFWGPGFDWTPDHNWGGSGMIALQEMLMQTPDQRIFLLPAWPADWDVDFKLHAPGNTVVEGSYRAGRLEQLSVIPAARLNDIILPAGMPPPK